LLMAATRPRCQHCKGGSNVVYSYKVHSNVARAAATCTAMRHMAARGDSNKAYAAARCTAMQHVQLQWGQ